jgi:hypothetical protein
MLDFYIAVGGFSAFLGEENLLPVKDFFVSSAVILHRTSMDKSVGFLELQFEVIMLTD